MSEQSAPVLQTHVAYPSMIYLMFYNTIDLCFLVYLYMFFFLVFESNMRILGYISQLISSNI